MKRTIWSFLELYSQVESAAHRSGPEVVLQVYWAIVGKQNSRDSSESDGTDSTWRNKIGSDANRKQED